jgi:putative methyltransferase (TIGR04325 family)
VPTVDPQGLLRLHSAHEDILNPAKLYLRQLMPPVAWQLGRWLYRQSLPEGDGSVTFRGDYPSWEKARDQSQGYDSDAILEKVKNALIEVRDGRAAYERDSVLFHEKEYNWPLISALWMAAHDRRKSGDPSLHVLDFGGSLGSSYFQCRDLFKGRVPLKWCVVEQPHFVDCGRKTFETDELRFYSTIEECLAEQRIDFLLMSSVLQYLPEPHALLRDALARNLDFVMLDLTAVLDVGNADRLTVQSVPPQIYRASYPAWFFNEGRLLEPFQGRYDLVTDFRTTNEWSLGDTVGRQKGYVFKRL